MIRESQKSMHIQLKNINANILGGGSNVPKRAH